ncbi:MAG: hypothetical protein ACYCQI_14040 [Gammaproteobacteria bacterium]
MAMKKKHSVIRTISTLFFMVPTIFNFVTNLCGLISSEARLAGRSIVMILILAVFLASLLTTTWLCLVAMLFVYLITHLSWMASLGVILGLNLLLVLMVGLLIARAKKNLTFPETRSQLSELVNLRD